MLTWLHISVDLEIYYIQSDTLLRNDWLRKIESLSPMETYYQEGKRV